MFMRASKRWLSECRKLVRRGRPMSVVGAGLTVLLALMSSGLGAPGLGMPAAGASPAPMTGGIASYALNVGEVFTWVIPILPTASTEPWNTNIEDDMYLPLYWFGIGAKTGINYKLSVGDPPVYSDGNKTVTVHMKDTLKWSTGAPVTSNDVKFYFELLQVGKATISVYRPGLMPDNIASVTYPNTYTFVLHLKHAYNPTWFTGNQLGWIYPLPVQAWDKTTLTAAASSSASSTPSGAKAVFTFIYSQAKERGTYTTNPMWKVVDGPFVISGYNAVTHAASFARNARYTGPTKPHLAGYKVYSFTTNTAELDALRSGAITFGYLPFGSLAETSYFKSHGYTVKPWHVLAEGAVELNYTSKAWGPLIRQLYIRQALQHLVDEPLYISHTLSGYGLPTYGPVEDYPGSAYVSPALRKDPYPYDPSAAKQLLTTHGWGAGPNGADVCRRPGTGPRDCGAGIAKGKQLSLKFLYETGTTSLFAEVSAFQTAARSAGIAVTLDGQTLTTMDSIAGTCPSSPPCNWALAGYSLFFWGYGQYTIVPTGSGEFGAGSSSGGGYDSPTAQRLLRAAREVPGSKSLYADEDFLSKNVAALWWPAADNQIVVVKDSLKGWQQLNPYQDYLPTDWYLSG